MFKKGPDIDKKKLLSKASDVKKDSLSRLKNFKTLIEHLDYNELQVLFKSHYSFIYHTFIDTFSTFDCNSKQRQEDLRCILFMLEKILVHNPDLIKKRWQFYSITFVMQKLLHRNNTWQLRQEGVRLFVLWYQILCDEQTPELQIMFATLVPGLVPKSSLPTPTSTPVTPTTPTSITTTTTPQQAIYQHQQYLNQQQASFHAQNSQAVQLPIKLCNIDPLVPAGPNELLPVNGGDESSFYLESLLQYMITQIMKPLWTSQDEARRNQDLSFAFIFNMFKKIYLKHLFPNFNSNLDFSSITKSSYHHSNVNRYVDEQSYVSDSSAMSSLPTQIGAGQRDGLYIDLRQAAYHVAPPSPMGSFASERANTEQENNILLSNYQAIVLKWLTRILRQDMMLGQDELTLRAGSNSSAERNQRDSRSQDSYKTRELSSGSVEPASNLVGSSDANHSSTMIQGVDGSSSEMEIARRIIGTWAENISVVHELFRRAFLNFYQPASMKRVVNVYKEWICNGSPTNAPGSQPGARSVKLGYSSFSDLLQVFVLNSANAFLTKVHNPSMLDEQVEMCKRIMNIYRYMVMKIYMNTQTWEQLLNVMIQITEHLFPIIPPEKKELTIGGRIAPAFFQTFIVSWIRANLYVHISSQMWNKFHRVMKNLVKWRELVEEWSTTMGSLTRVLVKHVYGLTLTDLPLDRPQERRRRPRALKSFSTAEVVSSGSNSNSVAGTPSSPGSMNQSAQKNSSPNNNNLNNNNSPSTTNSPETPTNRNNRSDSVRLPVGRSGFKDLSRLLTRSNSDGLINFQDSRLYHSSSKGDNLLISRLMRKIKSEYLLQESHLDFWSGRRSNSPVHNDAIDGTSLKDSNMIIEHEQALDSHHPNKSSNAQSGYGSGGDSLSSKSSCVSSANKRTSRGKQQEKCVLLGGTIRGWTHENSVIMWRRMLGLFGNINHIEDPDNHLVAIKCLAVILSDFIKTRENLGISLDNQSTPEQPDLIPPYTHTIAWLLEATHLPYKYEESRLLAYKLLCNMIIRRHDTELKSQYYGAFYESLQRGLYSQEPKVHASIIMNAPQLLSLELPGCTFLANILYERSRAMLIHQPSMNNSVKSLSPPPVANVPSSVQQQQQQQQIQTPPREQAIQILSSVMALHRPIRKLMVLKPEANNPMNLGTPGDIKTKIFDVLLNCNSRPVLMDTATRSKSLCSICVHVYQELCDRSDGLEVEKLFDTLLTDLQDSNNPKMARLICDMLRLFADHAALLATNRPAIVSSLIQIICQQVIRLSTEDSNKELVHSLLICLEDWCISVGKQFLMKPIEMQMVMSSEELDDTLARSLNDSLITIILRSLESVINDEQFVDDISQRGTRGSMVSSSKNSDTHSSGGQNSQGKNSSSSDQGGASAREGRTLINENATSSGQNLTAANRNKHNNIAIKLACRVTHLKLITYLDHFPVRQVGAATMSCCVNELDFLGEANLSEQDAAQQFKSSSSVVLLVINGSTIVSFIGSTKNESTGLYQPVHVIVRNLCGKFSWDAACLDLDTMNNNNSSNQLNHGFENQESKNYIVLDADSFQAGIERASMKYDSDFNEDGNNSSSLSSRSSTNRDCIGDLLNNLSFSAATTATLSANNSSLSSSYSQQQMQQRKRNTAQSVCNPRLKLAQAEETMIALLTNQRFQELNYNERSDESDKVVLNIQGSGKFAAHSINEFTRNQQEIPINAKQQQQHQANNSRTTISLEQCRQLVQQLGYLTWEKRFTIDSLAKNQRLLRELKNLDSQPNRDTHKIAVIYVANGQEDKTSILTNSTGSRAFEEFVSGLGWEVNLASHLGFKGGLQTNKSTGETSPYYCNATTEVMFHVSTRIPVQVPADDESLNRKLRHLGNDEIHIIWSEHTRDYRRGIIPTEFGDVIIAIYPMLTFQAYYRVQISAKGDVPMFGPLFDNCIVHQTSLAPLVRATAINASRAKRLNLPYYHTHYEERYRLIESMVQNYKEKLSFEDFAMQLYNTGELLLLQQQSGGPATTSATTTTTSEQQVGNAGVCC